MSIADYGLFGVPPSSLLFKLEMADGAVEGGGPSNPPYSKPTRVVVEEILEEYPLGTDLLRIEDHWQAMFSGGYHR